MVNLGKAQVLLEQGKLDDAIEVLGPDDASDPRHAIVAARIREAGGAIDTALELLEAGAQRHPGHMPTRLYRGMIACDADRPQLAEAMFREVIAAQPANDLARSYLALALLRMGRGAEACGIYRQHGFNDNVRFLVSLTQWVETRWIATGRFFGARTTDVEPARLRPGRSGRRAADRAAERAFAKKDFAGMLACVLPLVDPDDPGCEYAYFCAFGYEMLRDYDRALPYAQQICREKKLPPAYPAILARILVRLHRTAEAAEAIRRVETTAAEDYGVNYFSGVLCLAHGLDGEARRLFTRSYTTFLVDTIDAQLWQLKQAILEEEE